jgi:hypothetical protein
MMIKNSILYILITFIFIGCSKEYDCADSQILPAFIGFSLSDIDTFVLRRFKANDNYQNLIDTFIVKYGYSGQYERANDTTTVFVADGKNGIKADYDWEISIPAMNKTVFVSEIMSQNKTGKCGSGIFSMDKFGCNCTNDLYSAKKDNQIISFSNSDTSRHYIFIRN